MESADRLHRNDGHSKKQSALPPTETTLAPSRVKEVEKQTTKNKRGFHRQTSQRFILYVPGTLSPRAETDDASDKHVGIVR